MFSTTIATTKQRFTNAIICASYWAWMDMRCKYRRSVLGPFWETINVFVILSGMTYVSSAIFNTDVLETLPYVGTGMIVWYVLSSLILDSTGVFVANKEFIRNSTLPILLYVGRTIFRIFITFLHHSILFLIGILLLPISLTVYTPLALVGMLFVFINAFWVVPLLGYLCARYRDLEMIIKNLLQLTFFITPVFWNYNTMSEDKRHVVELNPLFYFMEAVRLPLLGQPVPLHYYGVLMCITLVGFILFLWVHRTMRRNLAFFI